MKLALALAVLVSICSPAYADQLSTTFDEGIDPENFSITQPAGFEVSVVDGKAVLTKLEGTGNGFANVNSTFTVKGDFDVTIVAERTMATPGSAMGLVTSHISEPDSFTDVYFSSTGNLVSNIFVSAVHQQSIIAAPASTVTFRIRRTGDHLIHEFDAGSGITGINDATNAVVAGPVQIGFFIGEEGGFSALAKVTFDDLAITGDAFTPPCGNGVLEAGETCDDDEPAWVAGEFCNASCEILLCGDADDSKTITVSDALHVLRTSVGTKTCDACVCDTDSSGGGSPTSISDAQRVLRKSVGQEVQLVCPACV